MAKNATFFPTLNHIRSAKAGKLEGFAVAEAFDQVSKSVAELHRKFDGMKPSTTTVQRQSTPSAGGASSSKSSPSTSALSFSALTTGTNTSAAMIVGPGATLDYTGVGIINASKIGGVRITGTPVAGYIPIATSGTTAVWQALGMITSLDCMSSTGLIGGLDCGGLS